MTSLDAVRKNRHTDHLSITDYRVMEDVDANRCYQTMSGRDMCELQTSTGRECRPMSTKKLQRLGLVDAVQPGNRYALNNEGREALKAWRDSRATTPTT